jgi:DNA-binding transcriptional MerR regulator
MEVLSLPRMARRCGVTQQWLRDYADAGKVPCLRAGNRYLFNPAAVQEALAVEAAKQRTNDTQQAEATEPQELQQQAHERGLDLRTAAEMLAEQERGGAQ